MRRSAEQEPFDAGAMPLEFGLSWSALDCLARTSEGPKLPGAPLRPDTRAQLRLGHEQGQQPLRKRYHNLKARHLSMSPFPYVKNRLLLALPRRELHRLKDVLEPVQCNREEVLVDADSALEHVYFPNSGIISIV